MAAACRALCRASSSGCGQRYAEPRPRWSDGSGHGFPRSMPARSARSASCSDAVLSGSAWTTDVDATPLALQSHFAAPDWSFVHPIAASPTACNAVEAALLVAAGLFTIGLWTRWSYATFVAVFFLLTLVKLESSGAHDLGLPLVTFLGWLAVPWGSGLSIGGWRLGRAPGDAGPDTASRVQGFAIWWPGFTLGVALLAAAYAKLRESGFEWITGGAVRYHFIADAGNAHVDWGLWVASHPWAAVLFSPRRDRRRGGVHPKHLRTRVGHAAGRWCDGRRSFPRPVPAPGYLLAAVVGAVAGVPAVGMAQSCTRPGGRFHRLRRASGAARFAARRDRGTARRAGVRFRCAYRSRTAAVELPHVLE